VNQAIHHLLFFLIDVSSENMRACLKIIEASLLLCGEQLMVVSIQSVSLFMTADALITLIKAYRVPPSCRICADCVQINNLKDTPAMQRLMVHSGTLHNPTLLSQAQP